MNILNTTGDNVCIAVQGVWNMAVQVTNACVLVCYASAGTIKCTICNACANCTRFVFDVLCTWNTFGCLIAYSNTTMSSSIT